jgi:hypothetical protein
MNFNASIYQLDKTGNDVTFEYKLTGTIEDLSIAKIAEFLAKRLFKIKKSQDKINKAGVTSRFYHLAKTKRLYFSFITENFEFNSELIETMRVNISKVGDEKALKIVLREVMDIFATETEIKL